MNWIPRTLSCFLSPLSVSYRIIIFLGATWRNSRLLHVISGESKPGLSHVVTRWFRSHLQVSQIVTQFLFHLKRLYKPAKYWLSITLFSKRKHISLGHWVGVIFWTKVSENCILAVVTRGLLSDNIVPGLSHNVSNRITMGANWSPSSRVLELTAPQVLESQPSLD